MSKKMNISRRSFLLGGTASVAALGLGSLVSCAAPSDMSTSVDSGSMTAAASYSCSNFEPVGNYNILAVSAGWHVYEALYDVNRKTNEVYNVLADGDPNKIDDLTYEIPLKKDRVFSDGNKLSFIDIQDCFAEYMTNENFKFFFSFIKSITGDDSKLIMHLNFPFGVDILKRRLSILRIHKHPSSTEGTKTYYVGSGPYAYKSINGSNGGKVEFVPNSFYKGDYPPRAKSMVWNVQEDSSARVNSLKGNNSFVLEDVPIDSIEDIKSKGFKVDINESISMPVIFFNMDAAPFNDVRVRQAVLYAVNDTKLIKDQLNNYGKEAHSFLPTNHPDFHECKNVYKYDAQKASDLLVQAKQEKLNFTLVVSDYSGLQIFAEEIEKNLSDLGITCKINVKDIVFSDLLAGEKHEQGDAYLTMLDPSVFGNDTDLLLSLVYGDNHINNDETNWAHAPNSRFNELQNLLKTARESSGETQKQAWDNAQDLISEEVPIYPILHRDIPTAYNEKQINDFRSISCSGIDMLGAAPVNK